MTPKKVVPVFLLIAVILTACGTPATPTMSSADVLGTANSVASTMVALTQAAIPTATPIPPTDTPSPTPQPTDTPLPPPTSNLPTIPPTQPPSNGETNCLRPLNMAEAGPKHDTVVRNQTKGTINLSLNLYNPNAFGQCGAISLSLGKNGSSMLGLPAGDWFAYAWVTKNNDTSTASGSFFVQPAQFDKLELCVRDEVIVYKPTC